MFKFLEIAGVLVAVSITVICLFILAREAVCAIFGHRPEIHKSMRRCGRCKEWM